MTRNSAVRVERDLAGTDDDEDWNLITESVLVDIRSRSKRRMDPQTLRWGSVDTLTAIVPASLSVLLGDRWTNLANGATYLVVEEPARGASRIRHAPVEVELRAV